MDQVVVCSVLPDGLCRVHQVTDAARVFTALRGENAVPFLPVAALECTPEMFKDATSWQLPAVKPIDQGAFLFQRVGIPDSIRRAVIAHFDYLGADVAAGLLQDWYRAVSRVQAVV